MSDNLSAADIMALTKDNDENTWMNNPFIYLIWIWCFSMFGGGFGGFGGKGGPPPQNNDYVTNSQMQDQFNFAALERQNNETIAAIRQAQLDTVGETKDLAYTNLGQIRDIEAMIASMQAQQASCCCETNRNIDSVRYENAQNTCAITNAIHQEGEITRALINQNMIQDLRDRLEQKDRELMTSNFMNSQQAQNATLINALRPFPSPAYITCSPYTSASNVCTGCCG